MVRYAALTHPTRLHKKYLAENRSKTATATLGAPATAPKRNPTSLRFQKAAIPLFTRAVAETL